MNHAGVWIGWVLAVAAVAAGGWFHGWPGVVLGLTIVAFWMLLQFSRAVRVLRGAGQAPVGHVGSAVMLQSRLRAGMSLVHVITITGSLGTRLGDDPETWQWIDAGGDRVVLELRGGKLTHWHLYRPATAPSPAQK